MALAPTASAAPPYPGRLGVEASGDAFVDIVRQSYRWDKPDGHGGWTALTRQDVDEHGWPLTDCRWISDSRPCAEWAGSIDDPEAYRVDRSGVYKGSFEGQATLVAAAGPFSIENRHYDSGRNLTTFDLVIPRPGPNHGLVVLEFRDTRRSPGSPANTGIRHFRLIRPGYPADTTRLFTDEYLRCLKSAGFSTIRFMNVLGTNGNVEWSANGTRPLPWSARKLIGDASEDQMDALNKKDGWPWEFVAELCSEANMDMWINIPESADDDYITSLAKLLKATLKPSLNIYIEDSNEVWNFGFLQYAWNKARAEEEVKKGVALYNYDNVNNVEIWAQRRHAQRVKDAVDLFAGVFGRAEVNGRIRGVLAGCTADPNGFFVCGRLSGMLDYLKATSGDPNKSIYAISTAIYYGGPSAAGERGTENASVDRILGDMRADIEKSRPDRLAVAALARKYSLPGGYCAYESGPSIGGGRRTNVANRIEAIRDPRQAALFKLNLADNFWLAGGNLAMQFTLAGPYSRFGAWGLTDDVANPDRNSLFQAARDLTGAEK